MTHQFSISSHQPEFMENFRQQLHQIDTTLSSPSPEMFSFPGTPTTTDDADDGGDQSDFEFGSYVTPDSPKDPTQKSNSPADKFFLNGRLLPHNFPAAVQTTTPTRSSFSGRENAAANSNYCIINLSRGTSVGSSITSSRSNSTSSRCSGGACSTCGGACSARTSLSEVSERRAFQKRIMKGYYCKTGSFRERNVSSQKWRFITPAPVLGPSRSMRGRREAGVGPAPAPASPRRKMREEGGKNNNNGGFWQRILRSFIATCKACHAMEAQEHEFDLDGIQCVEEFK